MTVETPPPASNTLRGSLGCSSNPGAGWWGEHWRSVMIVAVIIAAMGWALWPKSRPTAVELPAFEQKEERVPEK